MLTVVATCGVNIHSFWCIVRCLSALFDKPQYFSTHSIVFCRMMRFRFTLCNVSKLFIRVHILSSQWVVSMIWVNSVSWMMGLFIMVLKLCIQGHGLSWVNMFLSFVAIHRKRFLVTESQYEQNIPNPRICSKLGDKLHRNHCLWFNALQNQSRQQCI